MKLVNIHILGFFCWLLPVGFDNHVLQAQDMSLLQCLETTLANNKSLQVGRNNLHLYPHKTQEARANLWPKITVSADYKFFTNLPYQLLPLSVFNGPEGQFKEAQFGVPHNLGATVQAFMPVYNPSLRATIKSTEIIAESGSLQVERSEEQVIFDVINLYYNAQIMQHQIAFADSNLSNMDRLLATMQLLREQGLSKGTDVGKIELQKAQAQSQQAQLTGKLTQVLQGLNFFMGRDLNAPLSIPKDIEPDWNTEYAPSSTVDMRQIQVQNRLLVNELNLLKKSRLPTVSIVVSYGLTGFGYFQQPDPFFKIFPIGFVGAQATYPIWNKTTRHKIAQKEVEMESNRLQADLIQAQTDLQIANAVIQRSTALKNIPATRQQIALAESVYRQTVAQQRQGTATVVDILLADNALREAQSYHLHALVEYLKADLEWKKASGSIKN